VEDGAIVDRERGGGDVAPGGARGGLWAALEEGVLVGVEEGAAVSGEAQVLVGDAAVDGAAEGEQAAPGVVAALEHLLAVAAGEVLELVAQGRGGVVILVQAVAGGDEQAALLGGEQEDEAHHDGDGGAVEAALVDALEELALAVAVDAVDGLDEDLDGGADLAAELVGDLVLVAGAGGEEGGEVLVVGDADQAAQGEQADEGAEDQGLLEPQVVGGEGRVGGELAGWGVDEHPVGAVGDEADADAGGPQEHAHAFGGGGFPGAADEELVEVLAGRDEAEEEGGWARGVGGEGGGGAEGLAGLLEGELGGEVLVAAEVAGLDAEGFAEGEAEPGLVEFGPLAEVGGLPLGEGLAEAGAVFGGDEVEALWEGADEHRERQEGPRVVDEVEPFGVLAGDIAGGGHQRLLRASRSGTR
jgi:hypothetical protein